MFLPALRGPRLPMRVGLALMLAVTALVVASRAIHYASDPVPLPSNPDTAFYQWRSELLTARPPSALIDFSGPEGEGGSGYRVATPLLGALLRRVAAVDTYTLPALLVVGFNCLLALALGGAAYRYLKDPLLFAAVTLWAGWMLLTPPFIGFLDNVLALLLLAAALSFVNDGRRGAFMVAGFVFLAFLAHPPAALGFVVAVVSASTLRIVLERSWPATLSAEGSTVAGALGGAGLGYGVWRIGAWGPSSTLGDGLHPNEISQEAFAAQLNDWLVMFDLWRTVPLIALGALSFVLVDRVRFRTELFPRTAVLWLLPLLGTLGVFTSYGYPYHRFLTTSPAPILLAGVGLWLIISVLLAAPRKASFTSATVLGCAALGIAIAALVLVPPWVSGVRAWNQASFLGGYLRPVTAAIRAYLGADEKEPPPLVFIASSDQERPWSFRRGTSNRLRAGLPGSAITGSYVFVGDVDDFLAGRPSENPEIARLSQASFEDMRAGVGSRRPLVLMIRRWNPGELKDAPTRDRLVSIDEDLSVLTGPGLERPNPAAPALAFRAGAETRAVAAGERNGRPGLAHLVRVGLGILLIAFLPGALACRYFGRTAVVSFLATAPAISLGLNAFVGFLVLTITREPVTAAIAWVIVAVANLVGAGLLILGRRSRPIRDPSWTGAARDPSAA
jgi:type II secretory pathway pseudopilin PulG